MRIRSHLFLSAVLAGSWLVCGAAGAADVSPQPVRWHVLPKSITDVLVAPDGRCFYAAGGVRADKPTVSDEGLVTPGFHPLLFDRTGRLWCLDLDTHVILGVKGESVVTPRPPKGAEFALGTRRAPHVPAYEDAAGRLWFGHSRGVSWFDGKTWTSKDLADPAGLEVDRPMMPLQVAEDDAGRLFLWATNVERNRCGTQGVWSFDGKAWARYSRQDFLRNDDIVAVCPVRKGVALVNTVDGRLETLDLRAGDAAGEVDRLVPLLNDKEWNVREQATAGLKKLGRRAALDLKRHLTATEHPEVRSRIKIILDALRQPAAPVQSLPGGRYTCERVVVHAPRWRRRPGGERRWLARATRVVDTKTKQAFGRAMFVLGDGPALRIEGWPEVGGASLVSILPDKDGGLWIGIAERGLHHWDGRQLKRLSTVHTRTFWLVRGRDRLGRILLSDGERAAACWPGKPEAR
jgi:hypothetical protein